MNKLLAAVALCVCSASANAADLPARTSAPAPSLIAPVSVFSWTGAYVGAAVGIDYFVEKGPQTSTTRDEGFVGGAFAGYNAQFGSLVVGLEADIEGTGGVSNGYTYSLPVFGGYSSKIGLQGSVRARLGYAYQNVLYYVTGGVAMADVDINYFHNNVRQGFGETATGWTLGMGVDWAFYPNWVARFEYRYSDFGTVSNGLDMTWGFNIVNPTLRHEITSQAFRFGIAYRFGGRI